MPQMIFLSYVTPDTIAASRVLTRNILELEAAATVTILNLCAEPPVIEGATLVDPLDLDPTGDLECLGMIISDPKHVAEHFLPHLVSYGLDADQSVVFANPRSIFLEPPSDLLEIAERDRMALFTKLNVDLAPDSSFPQPRNALTNGIINKTLFAVDRSARPIIDWWRRRMNPREIASANYTHDVSWLDVIALSFSIEPQKLSGWGCSNKNMAASPEIHLSGGHLIQGDTRINSLDLSVYDTAFPTSICTPTGLPPRVLLSQHPDLWRIYSTWMNECEDNAFDHSAEYRYKRLANGEDVSKRIRRIYTTYLPGNEGFKENPFAADQADAFIDWLNSPPGGTRISRYLTDIWGRRHDLNQLFPIPDAGTEFGEWARTTGRSEELIPRWALPELPLKKTDQGISATSDYTTAPNHKGVLVSGYFTSVMGLSEAARLVVDAVNQTGMEYGTFTYERTVAGRTDEFLGEKTSSDPYDTHISCINIDTFSMFANDHPELFPQNSHRVGLWFWEASTIPPSMQQSFDFVDEVWVASKFVGDIFKQHSNVDVHLYPQPVPPPTASDKSRSELGLPDGFVFLFAFDFNSIVERKNPHALIKAFKEAFNPNEGPQLVIKTINGANRVYELERLRLDAIDRDDIHIVDEFFPAWKRDAWTASCDCYVSLHRSEGFGLTMAEAMLLGKPVIGTRYGGNLDFMNDRNSLLVDATLTTVPAGCAPYPEGATWGDPDVDQAAAYMRLVYRDQELANLLGSKAKADILHRHSREAAATWIANRLNVIDSQRKGELQTL